MTDIVLVAGTVLVAIAGFILAWYTRRLWRATEHLVTATERSSFVIAQGNQKLLEAAEEATKTEKIVRGRSDLLK